MVTLLMTACCRQHSDVEHATAHRLASQLQQSDRHRASQPDHWPIWALKPGSAAPLRKSGILFQGSEFVSWGQHLLLWTLHDRTRPGQACTTASHACKDTALRLLHARRCGICTHGMSHLGFCLKELERGIVQKCQLSRPSGASHQLQAQTLHVLAT